MGHLEKLGNTISIKIQRDKDGYIGRECPVEQCLGYFKVKPGTGLEGTPPCHCPYCGHEGEMSSFTTPDQIEYARSIATQKIGEAFRKDLKALEFNLKPRGMFGIGISMKVKEGPPLPIRYYREKQVETEIACDSCTLQYAIYGVFGWCPDCGAHNSLQILIKNLELADKELVLATSGEEAMADYLICDALENVVAAFDGFGREICSRKGVEIGFQNLPVARRKLQESFRFDFADTVTPDEWALARMLFQKRHVLAHKMGVIDADYLEKAGDDSAIVGRRIRVTAEEVTSAIHIVAAFGRRLYAEIMKGDAPLGSSGPRPGQASPIRRI